jgi:hypothetical protein
MTKLIFACIALLMLAPQVYAGERDTLKQFTGEWQGMGTQSDGGQWRIRINSRTYGYFVDYPSLVCGGMWRLLKTGDNRLVFKETLTYGIERCLDHGEVVITTITPNKFSYHWSGTKSKITAVGDLTRKLPVSK